MKIRVLPRIFFEKVNGTPTEVGLLAKAKIISINSSWGGAVGEVLNWYFNRYLERNTAHESNPTQHNRKKNHVERPGRMKSYARLNKKLSRAISGYFKKE